LTKPQTSFRISSPSIVAIARAYESLVRYACAMFIETQIDDLVQNTLERKLEEFLMRRSWREDNFFFKG
jgi:hypothetical protein